MTREILIAGIGNIFLGDDAFGVEVVHALATRPLPRAVRVRDFGIRGFDLACALLDAIDTVVLVDTIQRGETPGTLSLLEPDLVNLGNLNSACMDIINPHGMDPMQVLHLAASMGPITARVLVLGCEPRDFGDELEGRMGLSPEVRASVNEAVAMIHEIADGLLAGREQIDVQLQALGR